MLHSAAPAWTEHTNSCSLIFFLQRELAKLKEILKYVSKKIHHLYFLEEIPGLQGGEVSCYISKDRWEKKTKNNFGCTRQKCTMLSGLQAFPLTTGQRRETASSYKPALLQHHWCKPRAAPLPAISSSSPPQLRVFRSNVWFPKKQKPLFPKPLFLKQAEPRTDLCGSPPGQHRVVLGD